MIQAGKTKDGKLSIIARIGVKYIPFELDKIGQELVRTQANEDSISSVELIGMVLGGQARVSNASAHARLLKRIEEEEQLPLELDFTHSFLNCEETGQKNNLHLCLINHGKDYDLKLLSDTASSLFPVEEQIPIEDLSLPKLKEVLDKGNFSQTHNTIKRLKHWFAGRMELWGLAYG
ncbi:uncharacterized protein METZ01_LOCUS369966 [marine metagenome]|uniref:Uncharacterized protein n=1 Tax=marine metagenome TaxID=408172 RepID=A0A382T5M9_9ZZZZ